MGPAAAAREAAHGPPAARPARASAVRRLFGQRFAGGGPADRARYLRFAAADLDGADRGRSLARRALGRPDDLRRLAPLTRPEPGWLTTVIQSTYADLSLWRLFMTKCTGA